MSLQTCWCIRFFSSYAPPYTCRGRRLFTCSPHKNTCAALSRYDWQLDFALNIDVAARASLQTHDTRTRASYPAYPQPRQFLLLVQLTPADNGSLDGPAASVIERYPPRKVLSLY
jgi:hypothetical protein